MKTPYALAIVGVTGLVGGECLRQALADPCVTRVVALARRPLAAPALGDSKLEAHVVDLDRPETYAAFLTVDAVLCALGTTIRVAGSQAAFRRVDHDYPLAVARAALERGARHFLLVSALGADAGSRVFYNRVKGEVERDLQALGYPSLTIARPSLLVGQRPELRLGEEVLKRLGFLLPRAYKPVAASVVAGALLAAAREEQPGTRVLESAVLPQLSTGTSRPHQRP
jgi:uncharacterized protein YbjT (DUF2867 family)